MPEILVEVRPRTQSAGDLKPSAPKLESLNDRLDEIAATLTVLSKRLGDKLESIQGTSETGYAIEEIELKVSIDLESEAGVVIARAKASAGFEASLKWKRK